MATRLIDRLRSTGEDLRRWWRQHRERLGHDTGYAVAFTSVLIAATDLLVSRYRIRHAGRVVIRAYIALQRIFSPPVPAWHTDAHIETA